MPVQFNRYISFRAGSLVVSNLHVRFSVKKSKSSEPNTLELQVYGMSEASANALSREGDVIELDIGYEQHHGIVFKGHLRDVSRARAGADIVTTIEAGDGDTAYLDSTTNKTFKTGDSLDTIVKNLVARIPDVVLGDISSLPTTSIRRPLVAIGDVVTKINRLASTYGFDWSIQNGVFVATVRDSYIGNKTILSPATGLLGIPTVEADGTVSINSLCNPNIAPHRLVSIHGIDDTFKVNGNFESANHRIAEGTFRVDEMEHSGSNFDNEFETKISKATPVSGGKAIVTQKARKRRLTA